MSKYVKSKYVIVRTEHAGAFAGVLVSLDDATRKAVLADSRWLWRWAGALTLSHMALSGTNKPDQCSFPPAVPRREVYGVKDVIHCTPTGRASIEGVPPWGA